MKENEHKSFTSPWVMVDILNDIRERLIRIENAVLQAQPVSQETQARKQEKNYVYGIKGIMHLFGVSNVTAQRYKRGIIREAVKQNGRIIVVDVDRALELFNERKDAEFDKLMNGEAKED